ncbi:MAG: multiheme c-type cytochrome [Polyangiaceae bacterium]|jgi:hypothetical protein
MPFANPFDKRATILGAAVLAAATALAACQGCRSTSGPTKEGGGGGLSDGTTPTVRLYLVSDLAGALEPCGCTKDQLGGLDHAAAWIRAQRAAAPSSALVSAGPLFFMDPKLKDDRRDQDIAKAETIAAALKTLGFAAFAPGVNEWAGGEAELKKLEGESGGALLFANGVGAESTDSPPLGQWVVRNIGGVKVGFIGVSAAGEAPSLAPPPPVRVTPSTDAIARGVEALKKGGAQVFVALAATGRGEAKRLADAVPSLTAIVVGSPGGSGELNSPAPPPERIGNVLILETGNHLTTVGVLDLFVRDRDAPLVFADATGLELGQKREELRRRIDDLRGRIAQWDRDPAVKKEDVDARKAEVVTLESDLAALDVHATPQAGSFFRYGVQEIRDTLGVDPEVKAAAVAYYKQINEHNRAAFADRAPPPPAIDKPTYTGVDACSKCHKEERAVWDDTRHAHAYAALADQDKQFNLDCVSCHVTGYEQPGGSNVTHVARLENVQCEVCHGPGSKHGLDPHHVKMPNPKPQGDLCLGCHHSPHVEGFDPVKKMADILGPGHGL